MPHLYRHQETKCTVRPQGEGGRNRRKRFSRGSQEVDGSPKISFKVGSPKIFFKVGSPKLFFWSPKIFLKLVHLRYSFKFGHLNYLLVN